MHTTRESGFSHIVLALVAVVLLTIGLVGWRVMARQQQNTAPNNNLSANPAVTATPTATPTKEKAPDSAATIDNPTKVPTKEGQYFYIGEPAGQNNASPKKIIITLHGTEGSAERDYEVWKPFVVETSFALASLNWWDGSGDATTDYSTPEVMVRQVQELLTAYGYTANDVVVFEGFSRGSANSYPIAALDRASATPLIDVAVSSSGGATDTYFNLTTKSIPSQKLAKILTGVDWILACGDKDANPQRDGCEAMRNSQSFVEARGANVLGFLSDPNGIHGALTTSKLELAKQMFQLIEQKY